MRLAYVVAATVVNLLAWSDAISSAVDPKAVLGSGVARVDLVVDGHANELGTKTLLEEAPPVHSDSEAAQVDGEERQIGIAEKVKSLFTKASQSVVVAKATNVALAATGTAKVQATNLAAQLKATIDTSLAAAAPLWTQLGNNPTSQMMKTKITELSQTATNLMINGATKGKTSVEALALNYEAALNGLSRKSASMWTTLAGSPAVMKVNKMLGELVTDLVMTSATFVIRETLQKEASKLENIIVRSINKLLPHRKRIAADLAVKIQTKRTRFAQKVADAAVKAAVKSTKLFFKTSAKMIKINIDKHLGNLAPDRKKVAIGSIIPPKTKFTELTDGVKAMLMTATKYAIKNRLKKRKLNFKVKIKSFSRRSTRHQKTKATDRTANKINTKIKEFGKKVSNAIMTVAESTKTILQNLTLRSS
ncbi:unnamed protein product [Hyaloperonospora brassicae]|uniref:Uncharacterized protein n=1 Tax=Hyaloperonospora brassicae TaxID=162125 RepID=A0AAV0T2X2_HYABA|nr:unnamed protein product [Hyaloperonospora brassicae]